MKPEHNEIFEDIRAATESLRRTVEAIPADLLEQRPGPDEWSVKEILVHVRNVVMLVYGMRIRQLLFQDEPVFANYDEDNHLLAAGRPQLPVAELVDMIEIDHQQTLRLLSGLSDQDWQRQGNHPEYGSMSLEYLVQRLARHAAEHTQQIADTFKALS